MPKVDAGSIIIPIESIIRVGLLDYQWVHECNCIIEDEPVVATVEWRGEVIQVAIGPGSLLCSPGCEPPGNLEVYHLRQPVWARGVVVSRMCPAAGDEEVLTTLSEYTGIKFERVEPAVLLEKGGVYARPSGLEFEPLEPVCGRLKPLVPLHPLAAPLSIEPEDCLDKPVEPVAGRWKGGLPLAVLGKVHVAYRFNTLYGPYPEALLLVSGLGESRGPLKLSYTLGVLHACGLVERVD